MRGLQLGASPVPSHCPMKPTAAPHRVLLQPSPCPFRLAAALGICCTLAAGVSARAGDILRGGGTTGPRGAPAAFGTNPATTTQARNNAKDTLARTTQAVLDVKAMQAAASAAARSGAANLGPDPNHPGFTLPNVPNGLATGGLVPITGLASPGVANPTTTWQGALTPVQTAASGRTTVHIKQTAQQALLAWETFNIGKETTLRFDQSGGKNASQWIAFNKINDPSGSPTQILGALRADGQVYVINQNGIIFGGSSQVNTHALVASALPINDNLVARGLLNNPDAQFLFTSLALPAGSKGTPAFTPPAALTPSGLSGDVVVQKGASLTSPTTPDHVGGRIALVGPNVHNAGTISTPDGQTILAAGQQVGFAAHPGSDPSLRGLDAYIGAVADPALANPPPAGSATNAGFIDAPRASVVIAGKNVSQLGVIDSSTSVSLNGRIDLLADYDAAGNLEDNNANSGTTGGVRNLSPFLFLPRSTGTVTLGADSVMRILPELSTTDIVIGTRLPLLSQVNLQGRAIQLAARSTIFAPNANVALSAGRWSFQPGGPTTNFIYAGGQIYLDAGATINVAGSTDVSAPVTENILSVQLRGSELADSPLQRGGPVRGVALNIDVRKTGTYNGLAWVGTPLGNAAGFAGLIQRTAAELTTAGGTVKLTAGESVIMQPGAKIDVSGGWTNYGGGLIHTTRLLSGGALYDIAQATPDRVYDGIYTGTFARSYAKYGITETFGHPLDLMGVHYEPGYLHGASGGTIAITAPAMALDGELLGRTIAGPRQQLATPLASTLALAFQAQNAAAPFLAYAPTPPAIVFGRGGGLPPADLFALDLQGQALALRVERRLKVVLSPDLVSIGGFGHLDLDNRDGSITVPAGLALTAPPGGSIKLKGANIDIQGRIAAPGGSVSVDVFNLPQTTLNALLTLQATPPPEPGRGTFTLGPRASLSTAGLIVDGRADSPARLTQPLVTADGKNSIDGGAVAIGSYRADLLPGSMIDVSGGVAVSATGKRTFGKGGSIALSAGQDLNIASVLGGRLTFGATLRGFSGSTGGSLSVRTAQIQIGGSSAGPGVLHLAPEFFSAGGFGSFALTGYGAAGALPGEFLPAVAIAPGTVIAPVAQGWLALTTATDVTLAPALLPVGLRTPVSLTFAAPGVTDIYTSTLLLARGDFVMGAGAAIRTDPRGSVSISGNTAAVLGSIIAPGGTITVSGKNNSAILELNQTGAAQPNVDLGPRSFLSTAGTTVLTPDPRGHRTGAVLDGGKITISGNIVAEAGAVLDVSGAHDVFDLSPAYGGAAGRGAPLDYNLNDIHLARSLTLSLAGSRVVPTPVASHGGTIALLGDQELFTDATLLGRAGGPAGLGGTLIISSGRFTPVSAIALTPLDPTLIVTQDGRAIPAAFYGPGQNAVRNPVRDRTGAALPGLGYFAANRFSEGGFDALTLQGTVQFSGAVTIEARRSLSVAEARGVDGGVIYADAAVRLSAPYVALGKAFQTPLGPQQTNVPFATPVSPAFGPGSLTVAARLIDLGTLSLQGIGAAHFIADGGEIRGDGTLDVAGAITLRAAQIYPPTGVTFTIAASDYLDGGVTHGGSVTIIGSGTRAVPLSAGGQLNVYGSTITQGGTLRAPLGGITLGWDGTGTAPKNANTGAAVAVTQQLTLARGSITSVSGLDPATGAALLIPYGLNLNGTSWIDPAGTDITAGGLPVKTVTLGGANVAVQPGASIDLRGGGDLYAYRFVTGKGGTRDLLASSASFAVIPGYAADYAPYAPFNSSPATANLGGDAGYVNPTLAVGDRVHLGASAGLAAGDYTLLPARYALLPGAFLVTPQSTLPVGTRALPEGANYVSGYRFNDLSSARSGQPPLARFEVANATTVRARAQYDEFAAVSFLRDSATALGSAAPRLPVDAGHLIFSAIQGMNLQGAVLAQGAPGGRGGLVDVSSPLDIIVAAPGAAAVPGSIVLDAALLSSFRADSLLIGGTRQTGPGSTAIAVRTGHLTVDNAGAPLTAPDVILVANQTLTLAPGAQVAQKGSAPGTDTALVLGDAAAAGSGDGLLLRVSSDSAASLKRAGITTSTVPHMVVGAGAQIAGASVLLDSTYGTSLDPTASLTGDAITLNSGQISLEFDAPGAVPLIAGLMLSGPALQGLQTAQALSLTSYSSIDLYGHGTFSTAGKFALHAAQIRGFNAGGGTVSFAAPEIILDNGAPGTALGATAAADGTLAFDATTIRLGAGAVRVDQFAHLAMSATGGVLTEGAGALTTQSALTITAPLVTGAKAANYAITAGGALLITAPVDGVASIVGGLGASLSLTGASIADNSTIRLPSGTLTLRATAGDVVVGELAASQLEVGGTAQTFYDLMKYTDGGQINVISDAGSVTLGAQSIVNVAAQTGGGSAGGLAIRAQAGTFTLGGVLFGQSGAGGQSGTFALDVGSLTSVAPANAILDAAAFNQARTLRVRSGDVLIDGLATARTFNLSADQGSITVTGRIDAHGATGGTINLVAGGSVTLQSGAELTVAAQRFSSAGKGGAVALEAGAERNGTASATGFVDVQTGATIDLSVASVLGADAGETAAKTAAAQALGNFTGTLHLRAPQTAGHTDVQMKPVNGTVLNASGIVVEGYQIFDLTLTGGAITGTGSTLAAGGVIRSSGVNVQGSIFANGTLFTSNTAGMTGTLFASNGGLVPVVSIVPGAEVINTAAAGAPSFTLGTSGTSTIVLPGTGGSVLFPAGTPGNDTITSTLAGTITSASGVATALTANTATAMAAGSTLTLTGAGTVRFAAGNGGAIPIALQPGTSFTTSAAGTTGTVSGRGSAVTLNTSGTSALLLTAGTTVLFPGGTPGNDRISSTVAGTITSASGVVTPLAANVNTAIAAGSSVTLANAGTVKFSTGTGGAIPVTLMAGSFSTSGATGVTPATGNLTLGTLTSTATSDWQLQTSRFGPNLVPGVLTLRAAGNLVFFNALSDGFESSDYTAELLAPNPLLAANAQSYSYRLASGADFTAADFHQMQPLAGLSSNLGSVLVGKNYGTNVFTPTGVNATTANAVTTRFQVIRTGSGEIDIAAGRDVKLLNQLATIYTAGTRIAAPTVLPDGTFDLPIIDASGGTQTLGAIQQPAGHTPQYSLAGGSVTIAAQNDLSHQTQSNAGALIADSSKELPINWLNRRGFVDPATGQFGKGVYGDIASTSWWVDFSNFFEGVGALGGGNVTLTAGRDVSNFDGLVPTNARMPQGVPDASQLVELGGGDLLVRAGRNIDGGVYYLERGQGTLRAGNEIKTNLTRSPSRQNLVTPNEYLSEENWLPTTLFLGQGSYHVAAAGNLLLGPVANPFLLPGGYNNTFWYKTYFSTYAPDDAIDVASLGGQVTLRASAATSGKATPLLSNWLGNVSLLSVNSPTRSISNFQPWLRLDEANVGAFSTAVTLMPATLRATAFSGDINLIGGLTLSPSPTGTVDLAAAGAINGLQKNGAFTSVGLTTSVWGSSRLNLSDADPTNIPGLTNPLAYQLVAGTSPGLARQSSATFFSSFDKLFAETGATAGNSAVLQTKLALHDSGLLHLGDPQPVHLYATAGDISGLTFFSGKAARILAGRDLTDVAIYVQNLAESDVTIVAAGRDLIAYHANSQLRAASAAPGHVVNPGEIPLAGDLQISGPGTLEVLAGRDLDLGTGAGNSDGTGTGITSIGNARNPSLPFDGAGLVVGAGIGLANGLAGSALDFETFLGTYLNTTAGAAYLTELAGTNPALKELSGATALDQLSEEQRAIIALQVFYLVLRDAGRSQTAATPTATGTDAAATVTGGYAAGTAAIATLFGPATGQGDIKNRARDIRTRSGGNISIFAPAGKLTLASSTIGNPLAPPGIVTEAGGNVNVFTDGSVDLGIARIFTLRGGNIIMWSSKGDIAAGSSAKTVATAPPTRVVIDPQTADVKTDLAGLATGGGIGVLASVAGVMPGDVDLIAPSGVVDAGDAGIRVSGNLNIAATAVLNASNIAAGGTTAGTPAAPSVAAPSLASVAPPAQPPPGDPAKEQREKEREKAREQAQEADSLITVEVIGYGGESNSTP